MTEEQFEKLIKTMEEINKTLGKIYNATGSGGHCSNCCGGE